MTCCSCPQLPSFLQISAYVEHSALYFHFVGYIVDLSLDVENAVHTCKPQSVRKTCRSCQCLRRTWSSYMVNLNVWRLRIFYVIVIQGGPHQEKPPVIICDNYLKFCQIVEIIVNFWHYKDYLLVNTKVPLRLRNWLDFIHNYFKLSRASGTWKHRHQSMVAKAVGFLWLPQ